LYVFSEEIRRKQKTSGDLSMPCGLPFPGTIVTPGLHKGVSL
jgi:hypothetical protein